MFKKTLWAAMTLNLLAMPTLAAPTVTLNGQVWFNYTANTGENQVNFGRNLSVGYNGFNLTRAYLISNIKFDDKLSGQVIFDANAFAPTLLGSATLNNGSLSTSTINNLGEIAYLRHAYLQYNNPLPTLDNVRFGVLPTFWFAYELAKYWRYSFQSGDIGGKYFGVSSAASGLTAAGSFDHFRYEAGVFDTPVLTSGYPLSNGSYKVAPAGGRKNVQARVAVDLPLGLELSGLYSYYRPIGFDQLDNCFALIGHKTENLILAAEYGKGWAHPTGGTAIDRDSLSAFGIFGGGLINPNLRNLDLILRLDAVKPDQSTANNGYKEWIAGIGYLPTPNIKTMLSDTLRTHEDGTANENIVALTYSFTY